MTIPEALPRSFYDRDTITVARELLGCRLIHIVEGQTRIGRIVETEAYLGPHDLAAHSARGLTDRTRPMFGPPGHAYVYLIYGIHHCFNVVTEAEGHASAVLVRALEPVTGINSKTSGPGLLCKAMAIHRGLSGADLTIPPLFISHDETGARHDIVERPRIGVDYAGEWALQPLRYYISGNRFVSRR